MRKGRGEIAAKDRDADAERVMGISRGRPKFRWKEVVERDMREVGEGAVR